MPKLAIGHVTEIGFIYAKLSYERNEINLPNALKRSEHNHSTKARGCFIVENWYGDVSDVTDDGDDVTNGADNDAAVEDVENAGAT